VDGQGKGHLKKYLIACYEDAGFRRENNTSKMGVLTPCKRKGKHKTSLKKLSGAYREVSQRPQKKDEKRRGDWHGVLGADQSVRKSLRD